MLEPEHGDYLPEIFVTAIDEDLDKGRSTSLYLASMFLMIFRQSAGLLVTYPKTLFFGL